MCLKRVNNIYFVQHNLKKRNNTSGGQIVKWKQQKNEGINI